MPRIIPPTPSINPGARPNPIIKAPTASPSAPKNKKIKRKTLRLSKPNCKKYSAKKQIEYFRSNLRTLQYAYRSGGKSLRRRRSICRPKAVWGTIYANNF